MLPAIWLVPFHGVVVVLKLVILVFSLVSVCSSIGSKQRMFPYKPNLLNNIKFIIYVNDVSNTKVNLIYMYLIKLKYESLTTNMMKQIYTTINNFPLKY